VRDQGGRLEELSEQENGDRGFLGTRGGARGLGVKINFGVGLMPYVQYSVTRGKKKGEMDWALSIGPHSEK